MGDSSAVPGEMHTCRGIMWLLLLAFHWLPIPMKQKHTVPEAEEELKQASRGAQSACLLFWELMH